MCDPAAINSAFALLGDQRGGSLVIDEEVYNDENTLRMWREYGIPHYKFVRSMGVKRA